MYNPNYYIPDLLEIQRQGFFQFLEKGIIEAFKDKGLLSKGINNDKFEVTVILLMHKMKCTFLKESALRHQVTGQ